MNARTHDDDAILSYLRRRWRRPLDATTVPQAQRALALPASTAQRLRLHDAFVARPALLRRLRGYGQTPLSLTLTDDEKLLARRVLDGETATEAAAALALDAAAERAARRVLRHVGLLRGDRAAPGAPGALGAQRALDGVGLNFHTIRLEGDSTFGVHWAVDFLLLVNSEYPGQHLSIEDACAQTHRRMRVDVFDGEIVATDPRSLYLLRGGTWGSNNLFWSEEHARAWLRTNPDAHSEGARLATYYAAMRDAKITLADARGVRRDAEGYRRRIRRALRRMGSEPR